MSKEERDECDFCLGVKGLSDKELLQKHAEQGDNLFIVYGKNHYMESTVIHYNKIVEEELENRKLEFVKNE